MVEMGFLIIGLGLMFMGYYVVKFGVHFYKDETRPHIKQFITVGDYIVIGTILFVGVLMIVLGLGFIFI